MMTDATYRPNRSYRKVAIKKRGKYVGDYFIKAPTTEDVIKIIDDIHFCQRYAQESESDVLYDAIAFGLPQIKESILRDPKLEPTQGTKEHSDWKRRIKLMELRGQEHSDNDYSELAEICDRMGEEDFSAWYESEFPNDNPTWFWNRYNRETKDRVKETDTIRQWLMEFLTGKGLVKRSEVITAAKEAGLIVDDSDIKRFDNLVKYDGFLSEKPGYWTYRDNNIIPLNRMKLEVM